MTNTKDIKVKINNTQALKDNDLRVRHFFDEDNPNYFGGGRAFTVVFRKKNRHVMEIATSICHSMDVFSKRVGTVKAIDNFINDRKICIPIIYNEQETLTLMFSY
jgi:hypothetical protein